MKIDWNKAYAILFNLLDNKDEKTYFKGPDFLDVLREYDYGIPSYYIYIDELKKQGKSTSRKNYYRDEFFKLNEPDRKSICSKFGDFFLDKNPESLLVSDYIEFFKGNEKKKAINYKVKALEKIYNIEPQIEFDNDSPKISIEKADSPKVFVTYSWDSSSHQEWVRGLVNTLRTTDGINATFDKHIIQQGTINLNRMMVDNIYENDFIVIVLTENYAKKANEELGGVGVESNYLMNILNDPKKKDKIIILNKHDGNSKSTIPNFLDGYNYIDISDEEFKTGYDKLVYQIHGIDQFEIPKLGKVRELAPKKAKGLKFKIDEIVTDNKSRIDIKLYEYIKDQVKQPIEYAYRFDFGSPHPRDTFLNLYKLEREFESPEFEFLDENLEKVKKILEKAINNFTGNIALETYPSDQRGFQEIPREWIFNAPDRFEDAQYKINLSSHEMYKTYCNFIRQCRKTFII